jgi:hypothetical protein
MRPLHDGPPIIDAVGGDRGEIDLLVGVLAHVRDPDVLAVDPEAPRVPQTVLPQPGVAALGIEPHDSSQEGVRILSVTKGVVAGASVAEADKEGTVRPELDHASVVIGGGLLYGQQHAFRRHVDDAVEPELRDDGVALQIGIVDEDPGVVLRMSHHPQ